MTSETNAKQGRVYFVGAGPGDPRLLTVRAAEILRTARTVYYDPAVDPSMIGPGYVPLSVGDARGFATLVREAREGHRVARLLPEDPLLFGAAEAETEEVLHAGVACEMVAGIPAAIAAGACAGIALTTATDPSPSFALVRISSFGEELHDWSKLATATDTIAVECPAREVVEVARSLVFFDRPKSCPAAFVRAVSRSEQDVVSARLDEIGVAVEKIGDERGWLIVGGSVGRKDLLAWVGTQPLRGKRVLVTRAVGDAGELASALRERGAQPIVAPMIAFRKVDDDKSKAAREALRRMAACDWVIFTSGTGVTHVRDLLDAEKLDARAFGTAKVAAIGPATAQELIDALRVRPDLVPSETRGEGLAAELLRALGDATLGRSKKLMLLRAAVARDVLPDTLRAAGWDVEIVPVYETTAPDPPDVAVVTAALASGTIDAVTFTSGSTVDHLCDALGEGAAGLLARTLVASIGPVTTEACARRGVRVDVTSGTATIAGLVAELERAIFPKAAPRSAG